MNRHLLLGNIQKNKQNTLGHSKFIIGVDNYVLCLPDDLENDTITKNN